MEKREFREERGKHMESAREGERKLEKSVGGEEAGSNLLNNI